MIKDYSLLLLQKTINQAIRLDPSLPVKLQAFEDKVLEIVISPLKVHFYLTFTQQSIQLMSSHPGPIDTVIHSSPLGLIRLSILPSSKVRSLFNDHIKISGDALLGQAIKQIFDEIDIDWEGHLAHFTGDVVAHQIGSVIRKGMNIKNRFQTSMQHQVSEYLQEELRVTPCREELNQFFNDIDKLSLQLERIEAHIHQHIIRHESH